MLGQWNSILPLDIIQLSVSPLEKVISDLSNGVQVYPPINQIFRALIDLDPNLVKVVIIGQDPYINQGQANGYAFAVNETEVIPPSLNNIFKEVENDLGRPPMSDRTLLSWVSQGVLLLNSSLSVIEGQPNSHHHLEWYKFTDNLIKYYSSINKHKVYILWGAFARNKKNLIKSDNNLILESAHPSPLSATRGFFNSKPFSKTNNYLQQHGITEILW